MYGDWRRPKNKVYVTPDTAIPEPPKDLLENPDEAAYHKTQVEIDEKIEALSDKNVCLI